MTDSWNSHPETEGAAETPGEGRRFPCGQCGAKLVFEPGTTALVCQYCGFENPIAESDTIIRELDYREYLARLAEGEVLQETPTVKCTACAAEVDRPEHVTAFACPFCGSDIVGAAYSRKQIRPKSLLPFGVSREQARSGVLGWIKSRWFAPSAFKKYARMDNRLNGMYLPYWTYDCNTISDYVGQRGDYYWETQTYTTVESGKTVTKTRQVRKIRWRRVVGTVNNVFDDVLVVASQSLPSRHVVSLEPWDLENLVPYGDEYLSGFRAESYQVDLEQGFEVAKGIMRPEIERSIRSDIGGDEQRISSIDTAYEDITFKHLLLPIWITAYRYHERVYRVFVNGRTGEVQGERPWSWIKITLFVLLLLGLVGGALLLLEQGGVFGQASQWVRPGASLAGVFGLGPGVVPKRLWSALWPKKTSWVGWVRMV